MFFPFYGFDEAEISEANRLSQLEFERVRDFILHYHLTQRPDSELWKKSQSMEIPDSLSHKVDLFKIEAILSFTKWSLFSMRVG